MAENNDFNLVISDEESVNVLSGRSPHNPFNQQGSPNVEFIRRSSGEGNREFMSHKGVVSPLTNAAIASYDKAYTLEGSEQDGFFDHENITSPKPNSEIVYGSYSVPSAESNKKNQFIKKAKSQPTEPLVVEEDQRQRDSSRGQQQHHRGENHMYQDHQEHNEAVPERIVQTGSEGYDYQDFGDFNGTETSHNITDDDDQRGQSLRDSQNSGPVRYSKMTEEEAARAFENRKKELFSTYLKKGPKKTQAPRPGPMPSKTKTNNSNYKQIDDAGKGNKKEILLQEEGTFGKSSLNSFVIFNNKDNQTPNQPNRPNTRDSAEKHQRRAPSSDKKENPTNTVNLAKQRKESPAGRNKPSNAQRQTPKSQKAPAINAVQRPKGTTPRENAQNYQREEPKVHVDIKRPPSAKNKPNEQRIDYYPGHVEDADEDEEDHQYYQERERPSYNQRAEHSHHQQQQHRSQTQSQHQSQHHSLHQHEEYGNEYFLNTKKQEILSDIHNLDGEIQRLESEEIAKRAGKNREKNGDFNRIYGAKGNNGYQQQHSRGKANNPIEAQPQNQKENIASRGRSNSQDKRQIQRNDSNERNAQERGRENIYPISQNIQDEREKRQKINQLKVDKGMRNTETSQGSVREQVQQSYMVLNERGFEHHYEYLYERALVQKRGRDALHERSREMRESQELIHCTFSPSIKPRSVPKREDIITQTKNWQIEKERQQQINEKTKIERELRECTFYPNGMLDKDDNLAFNANEFYKRNIEWVKRKDADHMRKQNELYKSIMSGPERPKSHASLNVSRVQGSQILHDSKANSPTVAPGEMSKLLRNPSNKSFRSARDTKAERESSAKRRESSNNKREESEKRRASSKKLNRSNMSINQQQSQKVEKPAEDHENVNHSNSLGNLNMQSHIMESYAILDNLQYMLSAKDREKHEKTIQEKSNVDKRLKTVNAPTTNDNSKPAARNSFSKSKMRTTASPRRSQTQLGSKVAVATVGFDAKLLEGNTQSIMVRNNRYYVEERTVERPKSRASRERSRSTDSRRKVPTSSAGVKGNSSVRGGSYTAANQAKKRVESPFRKKNNTQKHETSVSKISYSEPIASPLQSLIGSPYSYGPFVNGPSPRYELNYVSKGLTSPTTQTLEKKYLDLLSQVNRVTNQIENINVENYSLQNDINSIQRKQANKSLLYS